MSPNVESEPAKVDKLSELPADMPVSPQNRPDTDKLPLSGAVFRFCLVEGTGDVEVALLAELQRGHVHLRQLRAAGIGKNALAHRLHTGRLHATLPCVYLLGRPHRDLLGRMMAAALYCRGDALVAGLATAQIWGLLDTTQSRGHDCPIDVLLAGRNARKQPGITIHRTPSLPKPDIRRRLGIPVTSPARTILDLAATMNELELESVISAAFRRNLVRRSQLTDVMQRNPRAKGIATLRRLLERTESLHFTRSIYERKLLTPIRAAELPLPVTNIVIDGMEIDGVWPNLRLVYEFDGWQDHGSRPGFEKDRVRDQRLLASGHQRLRITANQIDHHPYALVARMAGIIAALRAAATDTPAA